MAQIQASKVTPPMAKLLSRSMRNWRTDELDKPFILAPDMDLLKRIKAASPHVPKESILPGKFYAIDPARDGMAEVIMTSERVLPDKLPARENPILFGMDMGSDDTTAEVIMTKDGVHIDLKLTVAEQRRVVEAEVKGPCVRMWLSRGEHEHTYKHAPDFTHGQLKDGRFYCWRRKSDLDELARSKSPADVALCKALTGRILRDDVQ